MAAIFTGPAQFLPSGGDTKRATVAECQLGTIAMADDGREFIYVKAGAVIALNDAVRLNATLADVRSASTTQQMIIGIATAAFASADFGFIYHRGGNGATCKLTAATAVNSVLVSQAVAGTLVIGAATDFNQRPAVCSVAEAAGVGTVILY